MASQKPANHPYTLGAIALKGELGQLDTVGARFISDFGSRNVISGRCTTPDGLRDIKHRKNDPTDAVGSPGYPVDRPILPISISEFQQWSLKWSFLISSLINEVLRNSFW